MKKSRAFILGEVFAVLEAEHLFTVVAHGYGYNDGYYRVLESPAEALPPALEKMKVLGKSEKIPEINFPLPTGPLDASEQQDFSNGYRSEYAVQSFAQWFALRPSYGRPASLASEASYGRPASLASEATLTARFNMLLEPEDKVWLLQHGGGRLVREVIALLRTVEERTTTLPPSSGDRSEDSAMSFLREKIEQQER